MEVMFDGTDAGVRGLLQVGFEVQRLIFAMLRK